MRVLREFAVLLLLFSFSICVEAYAEVSSLDCFERVDKALVSCAEKCDSDACINRCDKTSEAKYETCEREAAVGDHDSKVAEVDLTRSIGTENGSVGGNSTTASSLGKPLARSSTKSEVCVTQYGNCPLSSSAQSGIPCTCPTVAGGYQAGLVYDLSADDRLPDFGPFPEWSTRAVMDLPTRAEFVKNLGSSNPSLMDVGQRMATVFQEAGYSDYGFYRVEAGFAVVARLEKIKPNGTPDPNGRHYKPTDSQPFGFGGFIAQLIYGPEGFYRVIVLIVSDRAVIAEGGPPTVTAADAWFVRAADRLPAEYGSLPFTSGHQVTALIYEFEKGSGDDKTAVVPTRRLSSEQHLRGAGIYERLGFGARP